MLPQLVPLIIILASNTNSVKYVITSSAGEINDNKGEFFLRSFSTLINSNAVSMLFNPLR